MTSSQFEDLVRQFADVKVSESNPGNHAPGTPLSVSLNLKEFAGNDPDKIILDITYTALVPLDHLSPDGIEATRDRLRNMALAAVQVDCLKVASEPDVFAACVDDEKETEGEESTIQ